MVDEKDQQLRGYTTHLSGRENLGQGKPLGRGFLACLFLGLGGIHPLWRGMYPACLALPSLGELLITSPSLSHTEFALTCGFTKPVRNPKKIYKKITASLPNRTAARIYTEGVKDAHHPLRGGVTD